MSANYWHAEAVRIAAERDDLRAQLEQERQRTAAAWQSRDEWRERAQKAEAACQWAEKDSRDLQQEQQRTAEAREVAQKLHNTCFFRDPDLCKWAVRDIRREFSWLKAED